MQNPAEPKAMSALEQHYTLAQVAQAWRVSEKTVRRMFQDKPGVLAISLPCLLPKHARRRAPRTTLRIPASLLELAHQNGTRGFQGIVRELRRG
jgi:AraC-like DNA-binding protein